MSDKVRGSSFVVRREGLLVRRSSGVVSGEWRGVPPDSDGWAGDDNRERAIAD